MTEKEKARWDALVVALAKKRVDEMLTDPTFAPGTPRPWNNPAKHAPWA